MYYLASTLSSTQTVSDDLHEAGIKDFYLHVVTRDESGLKQQHIHSSNYLETLDLVRNGFVGGALGLLFGSAGIAALIYLQPFGAEVHVPSFVYVALVVAATLFGTWEGGLVGIGSENRKLAKFHDDIDLGKYLILVYVRKRQEMSVRKVMQEQHADAQLVAIDRHFINPFSAVQRVSETSVPSA